MTTFLLTINANVDPTRTSILRTRFTQASNRRYNSFKTSLRKFLGDWGKSILGGVVFYETILEPFLQSAETEEITEGFEDNGGVSWMLPFLGAALLAGIRSADRNVKAAGRDTFDVPGLGQFQDELDIIRALNFRRLRGINQEMNRQIKQVLVRGVMDGLETDDIAKLIFDRVDKIGKRRAELLARTEVVRIHAEATLNRYERYGIMSVSGEVEFVTAGDDRVCPECEGLEGRVFSIADARGIIPVHPRCRCSWQPILV